MTYVLFRPLHSNRRSLTRGRSRRCTEAGTSRSTSAACPSRSMSRWLVCCRAWGLTRAASTLSTARPSSSRGDLQWRRTRWALGALNLAPSSLQPLRIEIKHVSWFVYFGLLILIFMVCPSPGGRVLAARCQGCQDDGQHLAEHGAGQRRFCGGGSLHIQLNLALQSLAFWGLQLMPCMLTLCMLYHLALGLHAM